MSTVETGDDSSSAPDSKKLKMDSTPEVTVTHGSNGSAKEKNGSHRDFLSVQIPELSELPSTIDSYASLYKYSVEHSEEFWSVIARRRIEWINDFTKVTSGDFADPDFQLKWFEDGQLNVSGWCGDGQDAKYTRCHAHLARVCFNMRSCWLVCSQLCGQALQNESEEGGAHLGPRRAGPRGLRYL